MEVSGRLPTDERTAPQLDAERLRQLYTTALLARLLDERMWTLQRQGKGPFAVSCAGHEVAQVGLTAALEPGTDIVAPYYRDLGVALTMGFTAREVMLGFFARAADPSSGGRQMPNHFACPRRKILSVSSPVCTQYLHAVGAALASRIRRDRSVVMAFTGEGSTAEGDFHEALNFASIHRLPVVFVIENNGWAISVPFEREVACARVSQRAAAYSMPGVSVDGGDIEEVYSAAWEAVQRARAGQGPTLIEARTVRLRPHSSDDDERRYRPGPEIAAAHAQDPLARLRRTLNERGILDDAAEAGLRARLEREGAEAVVFAEASPLPRPEEATRHVYYEGPSARAASTSTSSAATVARA